MRRIFLLLEARPEWKPERSFMIAAVGDVILCDVLAEKSPVYAQWSRPTFHRKLTIAAL